MVDVSTALAAAIAAGKPQRVLLEFKTNGSYTNPTTFSNEDIVVDRGVTLRETFNGDEDLTIGQCPSASLSFTLLNDVNQITSFEFGEFKAWLGARIDSGTPTGKTKTFSEGGVTRTYEFAPLGVFIAERPSVVRKQMIDITAYDRMGLLDKEWSATGISVTYNGLTAASLLSAICSNLGIEFLDVNGSTSGYAFLNSTLALSKKPDGIDQMTVKEVVGWIAEAACAVARFNRAGQLEFKWYSANPASVATYSESGYVEFEPSWYTVPAIDKLSVRNASATTETVVGTGTTGYIIQNNPFLRP